ncbi:MAG: hypothetical protein RL701_6865 [Pseudomonadota bacterium]|jgi:hypothetical protein
MPIEEPTPEYGGFLRSGAYPMLSKKLGQYSEFVVRAGGLAAMALIACGAGYILTQWLVPTRGGQLASAAESSLSESSFARFTGRHHQDNTRPEADPSARELRPTLTGAALARTSSGVTRSGLGHGRDGRDDADGPRGHAANGARRVRRRSGDVAEVSVGASASPDGAPVAGTTAELDLLSAEGLRTQLIADRVRAVDEAEAAGAGADAPEPARQADHQSQAVAAVAVGADHGEAPETLQHPSAAKPAPALHARVPALQLRAAANIEDLSVRGSLSASNVRRGVERLRPALAACYERAAQQAGRNRFGRIELSLMIDEAGRARAPHVSPQGSNQDGDMLPGLATCLGSVTSKLVSQAPDTGTVRASIVVNFTP